MEISNLKLCVMIIIVLLFGACIGFAIGYTAGFGVAIKIAVDKGVEFLHLQGYTLNIDIDKISSLLAIYNAKSGDNVALIHNNTRN